MGSDESCIRPSMLDLRGFTRMFPFNLHGDPRNKAHRLFTVYRQRDIRAISETKALFSWEIPSGRTRIRVGLSATLHIRSACMSTRTPPDTHRVPPGIIEGNRMEV